MYEALEVSVIVPTYNERESLPLLLHSLEDVLEGLSYEVVVVDDDSPDGTGDFAWQVSERDPRVRVVHRRDSRGLASAALVGLRCARSPLVFVMDSDLQHDPRALRKMIQRLQEGADLVIGSRHVHDGCIANWSWWRRMVSSVAAGLSVLRTGVRVRDPMSGYFGLKCEALDQLSEGVSPKGFKLLIEFLSRAQGLEVAEVGYTFRARTIGRSKFGPAVIAQYLGSFLPLRSRAHANSNYLGA